MRFPHRETSRLVIVGPSTYDHQALENLPAIANCSKQLQAILTDGNAGGFLPEHCLVSDGDVAPRQLTDRIEQYTSAAQDVLALWLIGHGLLDVETRKLHFALKATNPEDLYYTALPFDRLRRAIRDSPAKIKILMLDFCFSGTAITEMAMTGSREVEEIVGAEVDVEGTCIVTACSGRGIALAPPGGKYTAFTGAALEVLEAAAPIAMGEMIPRVGRLLKGRDYPLPHHAASDTAADLALVRGPVSPPAESSCVALQVQVVPPKPPGAPADEQRPIARMAAAQGAIVQRVAPKTQEHPLQPTDADACELSMLQLCTAAEEAARNDKELGSDLVIAALRKIITEMISLGGSTHSSTLEVRDLYGFWLARAGRYPDAGRLFSRLAQARAQIHGPEHPSVLASRHNLAHMTGLAEDVPGAVSQFTSLTEDRKRVLGDHHPDTILSMDGLAYWTARSGNTSKAVAMYLELSDDEDWQSGPDDRRTLEFLSQLAWAKGLNDDPAGARDSYADLAERWASLEGAQSPQARKYAEFRDHWAARAQSGH